LRTFPIRVARSVVVTRDRDERRPVFESRRLDVGGTHPHYFVRHETAYRTHGHQKIERPSISSGPMATFSAHTASPPPPS
jgi:hypothetical protein